MGKRSVDRQRSSAVCVLEGDQLQCRVLVNLLLKHITLCSVYNIF